MPRSALAAALAVLALSSRAAAEQPEPATLAGPDWMVVAAPLGGWLQNTARFDIPTGSSDLDGDGEKELVYSPYEMTDEGWGGGLVLNGFYKGVALTSVSFVFPSVNQSQVLGNITYVGGSIPTGTRFEPYLGLGLALVDTDVHIRGFRDTRFDDYGGMTLRGDAEIPWLDVDNAVVAPFPKVGLKIDLPIQHWHLQPFYSLMVEEVKTRARSGGGQVSLYEVDPETLELVDDIPEQTVTIRDFDTKKSDRYVSHLVGADFLIDFHYFVQLRGKAYYNVNHDLWTLRLIGSMMLTETLGVAAYFETSQKITVTNTYFLVGPALLLAPDEFMQKLMARRHRGSKR